MSIATMSIDGKIYNMDYDVAEHIRLLYIKDEKQADLIKKMYEALKECQRLMSHGLILDIIDAALSKVEGKA